MECGFLNRYVNEIRYPYRVQVYEEDVIYVIKSVEKIKNMSTLKRVREEIIKKEKNKEIAEKAQLHITGLLALRHQ
jgi:hypothetical protein